jgi:hypothetical protein
MWRVSDRVRNKAETICIESEAVHVYVSGAVLNGSL